MDDEKLEQLEQELFDGMTKLKEIEDEIALKEKQITKLKSLLNRGFIDWGKLKIQKIDKAWLSYALAEEDEPRKYLQTINFNVKKQRLESTNRKIMFLIKDINESIFIPYWQYPKLDQIIEINPLYSELFERGNLTNCDLEVARYTTKSGMEIYFTADLLEKILEMGNDITFNYNTPESKVTFECGNRFAIIKPRGKND